MRRRRVGVWQSGWRDRHDRSSVWGWSWTYFASRKPFINLYHPKVMIPPIPRSTMPGRKPRAGRFRCHHSRQSMLAQRYNLPLQKARPPPISRRRAQSTLPDRSPQPANTTAAVPEWTRDIVRSRSLRVCSTEVQVRAGIPRGGDGGKRSQRTLY